MRSELNIGMFTSQLDFRKQIMIDIQWKNMKHDFEKYILASRSGTQSKNAPEPDGNGILDNSNNNNPGIATDMVMMEMYQKNNTTDRSDSTIATNYESVTSSDSYEIKRWK